MRGERLKTLLAAALLFSVNAYIVHDLFAARFIAQLGSIEGVYIGLVRYILAHWGDLSWFSPWYGGIPFHNAYPPVLPFSAAAHGSVTGARLPRGCRAVLLPRPGHSVLDGVPSVRFPSL
jgi:hypothetical protein